MREMKKRLLKMFAENTSFKDPVVNCFKSMNAHRYVTHPIPAPAENIDYLYMAPTQ